jgi:hypothetical protein
MINRHESRSRSDTILPHRGLVLLAVTGLLAAGLASDAKQHSPAHADQADLTLVLECSKGDVPLVTPRTPIERGSFILQLTCLDPKTGQKGLKGFNTGQDGPLQPGQYGVYVLAKSDGVHSPSLGITFPTESLTRVDATLSGVAPDGVTYEVLPPTNNPGPDLRPPAPTTQYDG